MARSINNITVAGNVTREPELRFTPSGTAVLSLSIAVNESRKVNDEWVEEPNFFDVVAFGDLAEHVTESVEKGARVIVTGSLSYRSWETDEGEKRTKIEIKASDIGPSLTWATAVVTKAQRDNG